MDPTLIFPVIAEKRWRFTKKVFKAEEPQIMTYGEMPPDPSYLMSDNVKALVANAQIDIKGNTIMFSDIPPGMPYNEGNNISLVITDNDLEEIKRLFDLLSNEGRIEMQLQETFWSKAYGALTDKFGIGWQISAE